MDVNLKEYNITKCKSYFVLIESCLLSLVFLVFLSGLGFQESSMTKEARITV
jgi:hypothetical protein